MINLKTTISGYIAAASGLLSVVALMPSGLQKQLMECLPVSWQANTALIFGLVAFFAKMYQAKNMQDALKVTPVDTKVTTVETTATVPTVKPITDLNMPEK